MILKDLSLFQLFSFNVTFTFIIIFNSVQPEIFPALSHKQKSKPETRLDAQVRTLLHFRLQALVLDEYLALDVVG